jgi:hypothetical protein
VRLRWWLGDLDNLYARIKDRRWTPTIRSKAAAIFGFAFGINNARNEFLRMSDPLPALREFRTYLKSFFK